MAQDVSYVLDLALDFAHTKTSQISTTRLLKYFNIVRRYVGDMLTINVDENDFFDIWDTIGVIANNGEFPLPADDSDSEGIFKVKGVYIKPRATDTDYTPVREVKFNQLPEEWGWYLVNQPDTDPIYFIADNSVFIAPLFKSQNIDTNVKQVRFYGVKTLIDILSDATEAGIKINYKYLDSIALGIARYILMFRGKSNESLLKLQEFKDSINDMIDRESNKSDTDNQMTLPNDTNLQIPN